MKIIHIVLGKANPNRMNGVNKVVHQLTLAQHATNATVEIWGITPNPTAPSIDRPFRIRLFRQKKMPFSIDQALLDQLQADAGKILVHFHGGFIPVFAAIAKKLRRLGIPYYVTAHGAYNTIAMQKSGINKKIYFTLLEAGFLRHSEAVHCIGASELEALGRLLPSAKGTLIPNGHDLNPIERAFSTPKTPFLFGFCGRLRAHTKGLDILLKAFAKFCEQEYGTLTIIGDGEDREDLEALAKQLKISQQVQFLGPQYGVEKDILLTQMDVFLHPSRNEGMPGAVLEAAGLSVPVIISEATNLGKAVSASGAGLVLEKNTDSDLAEAMLQAHSAGKSGELKCWANNARNMVASKFAWKRIAQLHLEMYQS